MKFKQLHPISLILYFLSIVSFTMITMNPVLLTISFAGALASTIFIANKHSFKMYILLFVIISITNPLFSHNGETVLFCFLEQRITFEALFYGMANGILILTIMFWCMVFSFSFTQDKIAWLVGKMSPRLSVIFSMTLRFIPLFKNNAKSIYNAQISMGTYNQSSLKGKLKLIGNVFSALISLSIENAVETADTMRTRGFENPKRSFYSLFHFTKKDFFFCVITLVSSIIFSILLFSGEGKFSYYPSLKFLYISDFSIIFYLLFALMCFLPLLNDFSEDLRWKYLISKI